ncbi:MAG: glycosyltransferase [Acidobacteriota bacterium]
MKFIFTNSKPSIVHGLGAALAQLGHVVKIVDLGGLYNENHNALEELLTDMKPDYVISSGGWGKLNEILFPDLNEQDIPHIFWATEDPPYFKNLSLSYAHDSKYVFTTAAECIERYHQLSINANIMMFACLPSFHHQVAPNKNFMHDIIFVGNPYSQFKARVDGTKNILMPLIGQNYDVKVFGLDWWIDKSSPLTIPERLYGSGITYEEMRTAYSSAKIVLGLHSVDTSSTMMSVRTFEVLGCGAFYLTQWTPAIENLFQNHKHLVWSKSSEETLELINYYLAHPIERSKIAKQGQAEVYANHTYIHRANDMLQVIK